MEKKKNWKEGGRETGGTEKGDKEEEVAVA